MRSYRLDNAKVLMIFLVVLGHLIGITSDQMMENKALYMFIYSFHMPVFIMISGMLAKDVLTSENLVKMGNSILLPLALFTFLYEGLEILLNGSISWYPKFFAPYWLLWFLFSLLCWKLILPYLLKIKYPVLLAVVVAVMAGYVDSIGYSFGLSRTLYFLPFFVIGHNLSPAFFERINVTRYRVLAAIAILGGNLTLFIQIKDIQPEWLYGASSYSVLGNPHWWAGPIRLGFLALSFLSSMAILFLIPAKQTIVSHLGSRTLYVYLLHGFLIKAFSKFDILNPVIALPAPVVLSIFLVIALAISFLLSMKAVANFTDNILLLPIRNFFLKRTILLQRIRK